MPGEYSLYQSISLTELCVKNSPKYSNYEMFVFVSVFPTLVAFWPLANPQCVRQRCNNHIHRYFFLQIKDYYPSRIHRCSHEDGCLTDRERSKKGNAQAQDPLVSF